MKYFNLLIVAFSILSLQHCKELEEGGYNDTQRYPMSAHGTKLYRL